MADDETRKPICGIVMPISAIEGLGEAHWAEVLDILSSSVEQAGFEPNMVSNADDVGIIQKRIVQNLYDNPIVVCDVSGKNSNVMFELGMRLAFDKPTIIVKDDITNYSFDTAAIEHLEYPRDLRFSRIVDFKQRLAEKIEATYERSQSDSSYTTFLKNFGEFTVAKIGKKEVPGETFIIQEIMSLRQEISRLGRTARRSISEQNISKDADVILFIETDLPIEMVDEKLRKAISKIVGIKLLMIESNNRNNFCFFIITQPSEFIGHPQDKLSEILKGHGGAQIINISIVNQNPFRS